MVPEHVEVVVAPRSFNYSGTITGPIVLRHAARGDTPQDFPEPGWVDFPVVILGWWLAEVHALAAGSTTEATCSFRDGPFELRITPAQRTLWRVQCLGRYLDGDVPIADFVAPAGEVRETVRAAATAALAECERRGWTNADVDTLRRSL